MLEGLAEVEWRMAAGTVLSLDAAAGCEIRCHAGRLWLTEAGDAADIWLLPGQRHRISGRGRTVLEADADSRVGLRRAVQPENPGFWARMTRTTRIAADSSKQLRPAAG